MEVKGSEEVWLAQVLSNAAAATHIHTQYTQARALLAIPLKGVRPVVCLSLGEPGASSGAPPALQHAALSHTHPRVYVQQCDSVRESQVPVLCSSCSAAFKPLQ
eukprot:324424-Pelagomonas_calceolata.AAC.6